MRKTRAIDWVFSAGFFLITGFLLIALVYGLQYGTTPESELVYLSDTASDASITSVTVKFQTNHYLHFTISGQNVEYPDSLPEYQQVLDAVKNGSLITIGISTKKESLLKLSNTAPLYTLAVDRKPILDYQYTVNKGYRGSHAGPLILFGIFFLLSVWALFRCYKIGLTYPQRVKMMDANHEAGFTTVTKLCLM